MNIGAKHSLCLISMLSKMQPSESMPTKNSLVALKSRRIWAGSITIYDLRFAIYDLRFTIYDLRIQETRKRERGQPSPRELDLMPGTRGHGVRAPILNPPCTES